MPVTWITSKNKRREKIVGGIAKLPGRKDLFFRKPPIVCLVILISNCTPTRQNSSVWGADGASAGTAAAEGYICKIWNELSNHIVYDDAANKGDGSCFLQMPSQKFKLMYDANTDQGMSDSYYVSLIEGVRVKINYAYSMAFGGREPYSLLMPQCSASQTSSGSSEPNQERLMSYETFAASIEAEYYIEKAERIVGQALVPTEARKAIQSKFLEALAPLLNTQRIEPSPNSSPQTRFYLELENAQSNLEANARGKELAAPIITFATAFRTMKPTDTAAQ